MSDSNPSGRVQQRNRSEPRRRDALDDGVLENAPLTATRTDIPPEGPPLQHTPREGAIQGTLHRSDLPASMHDAYDVFRHLGRGARGERPRGTGDPLH